MLQADQYINPYALLLLPSEFSLAQPTYQ